MANSMTPMMRQYLEMKEKYSDCLLFFRLGDFYEMFFDDAKTASKELDLFLTGRDCGLSERAPMCGIPYHAVDTYVQKLIDKGYKVAICEQLEDPALAKGLVTRDVIRIITPGTVIEEKLLDEGQNSYIASIFYDEKAIGLSYADVSTGAFFCMQISGSNLQDQLNDELSRIQPREIIANPSLFSDPALKARIGSVYYLEPFHASAFLLGTAKQCLLSHFSIASLAGFGCEHLPYAISAAGALMSYLNETQKNALSHIRSLKPVNRSIYLVLDANTRRNLELTQPLRFDGSKKSTLLNLIDQTNTAMGSRMIREWLSCPLRSIDQINVRLDATACLKEHFSERKELIEELHGIYDIERLSSRIVYGTITPRDCVALSQTLKKINPIQSLLSVFSDPYLVNICKKLDPMGDICSLLESAICENPPSATKDGGFIREGFNAEVDELRAISKNSKEWVERLEAEEKDRTKIKNLRIGYNHVFGYYIEVTKSNLESVPEHYIRKQTLANAERFITPELKEVEKTILTAGEKLVALELQLFSDIRERLLSVTGRLQENASCLAALDCLISYAEAAEKFHYNRPQMNNSGLIRIEEGRHPVIEQTSQESFVPNDTLLDNHDNRMLIVTGPNMAGKSTYMRQTALITIMAHCGMFVPASKAEISICDRIFTRIGASDDLSSGQSTFMVEMNEVANILHNATRDSLLILDEIGRGTSTFDGLSIAWAVLEALADESSCGAKSLFATHYHELTELEGKIPGVKNYHVTVKEIGEDIVFLRRIVRGSGDRSFGIQVAKLAGIPDSVLSRAKVILKDLEESDIAHPAASPKERSGGSQVPKQINLFEINQEARAIKILKEMDVDNLTPKEAISELYSLHHMVADQEN